MGFPNYKMFFAGIGLVASMQTFYGCVLVMNNIFLPRVCGLLHCYAQTRFNYLRMRYGGHGFFKNQFTICHTKWVIFFRLMR